MDVEDNFTVVPDRKVKRLDRKRKKLEAQIKSCHSDEQSDSSSDQEKTGERIPKKCKETIEPDEKPVKGRLTSEQFEALKQRLHARKKILLTIPLFKLGHLGTAASLEKDPGTRQPIIATDVQTLLMYAAAGDQATYQPYRWCTLNKWNHLSQVVCLVFEGLTIQDYEENLECFKSARKILGNGVEMATPASDDLTISEDLSYISLSVNNIMKLKKDYGSLTKALETGAIYQVLPPTKGGEQSVETDEVSTDDKIAKPVTPSVTKAEPKPAEVFEIQPEPTPADIELIETLPEEINLPDPNKTSAEISSALLSSFPKAVDVPQREKKEVKDTFNRLQLLMSSELLVGEHYPLPGLERYSDYKFTKDGYAPVSETSPMYSIDCEWVVCRGGLNGLARVAVVDEDLEIVYHTLVKPEHPIVDYCTRFSGITKELLRDVTTTWEDVQIKLQEILPPDAILVGQSLGGDLDALKMVHPYVIDTSVIYNLTGHRRRKSKLSLMSELFLGERIQFLASGHNPVEDSVAAMKLVLLKLQKGYTFGDVLLGGEVPFRELNPWPLAPVKYTKEEKSGPKEPRVDLDASLNRACLYSKLFTFFQSCKKTCCLIAPSDSSRIYLAKTRNSGLTAPPHVIESSDLSKSIKQTRQESLNYFLTLTHISCGDFHNENNDNLKDRLRAVNKSITKVYKYMAQKGLLVVVFSGSKSGEPVKNGACFVAVKRPVM